MPDLPAKMKVLVVDDEADVVKVLRLRLEKNGFEVVSASNGREGLQKISSEKPDAVLLDVRMPEMDGIRVLEEIRRTDAGLPVFMLTADANKEPFDDAQRFQASGFIIKSSDIEQEVRNITSAIRLSPKYKQQK